MAENFRNSLHTVTLEFMRSTPTQWWVRNHYNVAVTLPRSEVELPQDDPEEGDKVELNVPGWLVMEKDLLPDPN